MSARSPSWTQPTLPGFDSAISSPESADGAEHCDSLAGLTTGPSGPEAAPASLFRRRASNSGPQTTDTCGPSGSTSFASAALQSSLASRLRARLPSGGGMEYAMTWKVRATPARRRISALRAAAPRTSGSGCTGWPTCRAEDSEQTGGHRGQADTMTSAASLSGWMTPTCCSENSLRGSGQDPEKRSANGHTVNLQDQVRLAGWATCSSRDGKGGYIGGRIRRGQISLDTLDVTAQLSGPPTTSSPAATASSGAPGRESIRSCSGWPTPQTADENMSRTKDGQAFAERWINRPNAGTNLAISAQSKTPGTGVLNPALPRWMMGFPASWDDAAIAAHRKLPRKRKAK